MKPTPEALLHIYRHSLAQYEAEGDVERVRVQNLMIAIQEAKRKALK